MLSRVVVVVLSVGLMVAVSCTQSSESPAPAPAEQGGVSAPEAPPAQAAPAPAQDEGSSPTEVISEGETSSVDDLVNPDAPPACQQGVRIACDCGRLGVREATCQEAVLTVRNIMTAQGTTEQRRAKACAAFRRGMEMICTPRPPK